MTTPDDDPARPSSASDPAAALDGYSPAPGDFNALGWVPYEQRWDGEGKMPRVNVLFHGPLPNLARIHPRRWAEVMTPCDRQSRSRIARCQGLTMKELGVAEAVEKALPPPAQELAREATGAATLPAPEAVRKPASKQVNVRLGAREHEELATAAAIAGTSPTTFARWLIVAGARRAIADHAATYSDLRSRS